MDIGNMSRPFRMPVRDHKRVIKINGCKSSTPCRDAPVSHYSISLSGIDSASSSSGGRNKRELMLQKSIAKVKRKLRNKSKAGGKRRRRVVRQSGDTDDEWETELEELINEPLIDSRESVPRRCDDEAARYNLFDDPCTPEKIRDAPIAYDLIRESPILRESGSLPSIKRRDDVIQRGELLPMVDLPSAEVREDESDEDEPRFHHESDLRTYPAASRKKETSEEDVESILLLRSMSARSNLLWDEFVGKNHDLAPPSAREPVKLTDSTRGLPDIPPKPRNNPVSPGMMRTRGYLDTATLKWISYPEGCDSENELEIVGRERRKKAKRRKQNRVTPRSVPGVYDNPSDILDNEFETGGRDGKRMTLNEFRFKQRMNKKELFPTSSRPYTQR